jgi:GNAT superfamily N-acetyltransferase
MAGELLLSEGFREDLIRIIANTPELEQTPMLRLLPAVDGISIVKFISKNQLVGGAAYDVGYILGQKGVAFKILAILPESRKQGYGTAALNLIEKHFVEKYNAVLVNGIPLDENAMSWFSKRGYSKVEDEPWTFIVKSLQPDILPQNKIGELVAYFKSH